MKGKIIITLLTLFILAGSIGTSVYFYRQYKNTKNLLANPSEVAQQEIKSVVSKISAFMELPTDEEPTMATVLEKDKLKDQDFFKSAENGDKILIYTKAMKAILFRPSTNKVIEVAPIQITKPTETPAPESTSEKSGTTPTPTKEAPAETTQQ